GAGCCAAVPETSTAVAATATTEPSTAFIPASSKRRTDGKMEIARLLTRLLVQVETVVYADRPERRDPADATTGGVVQVGQIELRLEAVHVADIEEGRQPNVEGQRNDVLDVAEDLAGAADPGPEVVLRRDLP